MGKKSVAEHRKMGAKQAMVGIRQGTGTASDNNGVSGTWKNYNTQPSQKDPTQESSKIASSDAIPLQKALAMGLHPKTGD